MEPEQVILFKELTKSKAEQFVEDFEITMAGLCKTYEIPTELFAEFAEQVWRRGFNDGCQCLNELNRSLMKR